MKKIIQLIATIALVSANNGYAWEWPTFQDIASWYFGNTGQLITISNQTGKPIIISFKNGQPVANGKPIVCKEFDWKKPNTTTATNAAPVAFGKGIQVLVDKKNAAIEPAQSVNSETK